MYKQYERIGLSEMTPWEPGFDMTGVSVSEADAGNGSPKAGDMIARNPKNHDDKWLVAEKYFTENLREVIQDFGWALALMKEGVKVRRAGWNGKGMWVTFVTDENYAEIFGVDDDDAEGTVELDPYTVMFTAAGTIQVGWLCSIADMDAEDWELAD